MRQLIKYSLPVVA